MWGDKKPDSAKGPLPQQQTNGHPVQNGSTASNPNAPSAKAPALTGEARTMAPEANFSNTTPSGIARLGSTLHVKGEITGNEDLLIDGSVEGLVQLEDRKLTVGASAKVTADVIAREVVVYGNVKGNLRARDRIEIKKDGSVVGDLTTARISIEDGAYFKGSIEIDKTGDLADSDKNTVRRTANATT
jgi:cytoskeletal protein CcmA (bactofilin family)